MSDKTGGDRAKSLIGTGPSAAQPSSKPSSLTSEIEMDSDAIPGRALSIKLSVRRGASVVLCEQLHLPIADAGIFELHTRHDGLADLPIRPFIALEITIGNGPEPPAEKRAGADQFNAPLRCTPPQVLRESVHDIAASPVDSQPGQHLVGQFHVDFLIAQIDPRHSGIVQEVLIAQVRTLMFDPDKAGEGTVPVAAQESDALILIYKVDRFGAHV